MLIAIYPTDIFTFIHSKTTTTLASKGLETFYMLMGKDKSMSLALEYYTALQKKDQALYVRT